MTIAEKKAAVLAKLSAIKNSQERFAHVIGEGRQAAPLEPPFKTEAFRVEGCLAKLWFVPKFRDGKCYFQTDSDSAIVKGIAAILCQFYSGQTPQEIIAHDPSFFEQVGITQHLTPNRRSSLSKIWEKIRGFALIHLPCDEKLAA